MKKFFTAVLATLTFTSAFAATSGTLLLKGTVPRLLDITVTAAPIAATLPLNTTQTNTQVAVVNEKSNSKTGYKVSISSANLGKLVHESVSTSVVNYSLRYNSSSVNLATGQTFTYSGAGSNNNNRNVDISYTGIAHDLLIEGDYSDTVTFTIAAN
ncbi:MAG: fimbrial protein [Bacteriovoracaceae bacterium]|nr:fimbrial protein [Bacteriovoracaceae bacterium]